MREPRSRDINKKPEAKKWLEDNKSKSLLFIEILNELTLAFVSDNDGYVNFSPPEYRFNNKKIGGYTFVRVTGQGHVTIEIRMLNDSWEVFEIKSMPDFGEVKEFIVKNKIANFSFDKQQLDERFYDDVMKSLSDSPELRKKRLKKAPPKPKKSLREVTVYERNPDVVAEVLERAKGVCESCEQNAPFHRAKNGTPYLEVHHKVRLADGGDDTVSNAIALCPNCHRKEHYG